MPALTIEPLFAFADLADGWSVISCATHPSGAVTVLAVERPNWQAYQRTWDLHSWEERIPDHFDPGGRHRLIHLPDGVPNAQLRVIDLQFEDDDLERALPLGADRWLLQSAIPHGANWFELDFDDLPPARVVDDSGTIVDEWRFGRPTFIQTTSDGRLWLGVAGSDERIPTWAEADLWQADADGRIQFEFKRDARLPVGVLSLAARESSVRFVNARSSNEVWLAYNTFGPTSEEAWVKMLIRLTNGVPTGVWPWSIIGDKAPTRLSDVFAIANDHVLLQGYDVTGEEVRHEPPNRDDNRLYLVSLATPRSMELFPVNAEGEWIGHFRTSAQGSKLYLETEEALYLVDAATLPLP